MNPLAIKINFKGAQKYASYLQGINKFVFRCILSDTFTTSLCISNGKCKN